MELAGQFIQAREGTRRAFTGRARYDNAKYGQGMQGRTTELQHCPPTYTSSAAPTGGEANPLPNGLDAAALNANACEVAYEASQGPIWRTHRTPRPQRCHRSLYTSPRAGSDLHARGPDRVRGSNRGVGGLARPTAKPRAYEIGLCTYRSRGSRV